MTDNREMKRLARRIAATEREVHGLTRAQQISRTIINDVSLEEQAKNQQETNDRVNEHDDDINNLDDGSGIWESDDSQEANDTAHDTAMRETETAEQVDEVNDGLTKQARVPAPVTGLAVVSNVASWDAVLGPIARVELAWDPVESGTDGEPILLSAFEVLSGDVSVVSIDGITTEVTLVSGQTQAFRVRAISEFGVPGDPSEEVSATAGFPDVVSLVPTVPSLTTGGGNAFARWDGNYTTPRDASALSVRVESKIGAGAWTAQGGALTGAGQQIIRARVGDSVQVRFVALDRMSRVTGISETASITVTGIELADIGDQIHNVLNSLETGLDEVRTTASGKNSIYRKTTEPGTAPGVLGDTWEQWTSLNATGKLKAFWRYQSTGWVQGVLDETYLPQVNIGQGTYGELEGDRIKAKTIFAKHVVIADTENMIPWDPENGVTPHRSVWTALPLSAVKDPTFGWGIAHPVGPASQTDGTYNTNLEFVPSKPSRMGAQYRFDVEPGASYRFRAGAALLSAAPTGFDKARLRIQAYDKDGVSIDVKTSPIITVTTTEVTYASMLYQAPANAVDVRIGWFKNFWSAGTLFTVMPSLMRAVDSTLVVDGSILADHIEMKEGFAEKFWANEFNVGKMSVDVLEPNYGSKLNIWASEAIEMIAGRQDETDDTVQGIADSVEQTRLDLDATNSAVADAQDAANVADGKALVAQQDAQNVSKRLTAQQAVFRVTATGAEVASKDGSNVVRITPDGVSIVQGGSPASTWDAGRLIVAEAVVVRAQIGNHIAEKSGAARTIFRPI